MERRVLELKEERDLFKQLITAAITGFCANPECYELTYDRISEMALEQAYDTIKQVNNYLKP